MPLFLYLLTSWNGARHRSSPSLDATPRHGNLGGRGSPSCLLGLLGRVGLVDHEDREGPLGPCTLQEKAALRVVMVGDETELLVPSRGGRETLERSLGGVGRWGEVGVDLNCVEEQASSAEQRHCACTFHARGDRDRDRGGGRARERASHEGATFRESAVHEGATALEGERLRGEDREGETSHGGVEACRGASREASSPVGVPSREEAPLEGVTSLGNASHEDATSPLGASHGGATHREGMVVGAIAHGGKAVGAKPREERGRAPEGIARGGRASREGLVRHGRLVGLGGREHLEGPEAHEDRERLEDHASHEGHARPNEGRSQRRCQGAGRRHIQRGSLLGSLMTAVIAWSAGTDLVGSTRREEVVVGREVAVVVLVEQDILGAAARPYDAGAPEEEQGVHLTSQDGSPQRAVAGEAFARMGGNSRSAEEGRSHNERQVDNHGRPWDTQDE